MLKASKSLKSFAQLTLLKFFSRSTKVINRRLLILNLFFVIILKHSITYLVPLFFLKPNLYSVRFSLIFGLILLCVIYVSISEAIRRETNICTHTNLKLT